MNAIITDFANSTITVKKVIGDTDTFFQEYSTGNNDIMFLTETPVIIHNPDKLKIQIVNHAPNTEKEG